jgi:hypothetical protein
MLYQKSNWDVMNIHCRTLRCLSKSVLLKIWSKVETACIFMTIFYILLCNLILKVRNILNYKIMTFLLVQWKSAPHIYSGHIWICKIIIKSIHLHHLVHDISPVVGSVQNYQPHFCLVHLKLPQTGVLKQNLYLTLQVTEIVNERKHLWGVWPLIRKLTSPWHLEK